MKKRLILAIVFSLMIISSMPGISAIEKSNARDFSYSALTPPTNQVVFVYFNGGAPVYTKAQLKTFLDNVLEPFTVKEITSIDTYDKLENATVLLLLGQTDLSSINMHVLTQFLREGGSLLIALPPDNFSTFDSVLDLFALKTLGKALDNSSYYENKTNIIVNDSYMIKEHPLIRSVLGNVSKVVIPDGIGLAKSEKEPRINATFESYSLMWGLNTTFIDENGNGKWDKNELSGSNISLIHIVETWYGGRIVILSSIEMITDNFLLNPEFDNLILCKALAYWLGNQIGYISIRDITANPTFLDITRDKLEINVTARVTNENNETLSQIQVNACLVRLNEIVVSAGAISIDDEPVYKARLNVSNVKPGVAYIYVMVYKKYYGYFWARGPEITLYKPPVNIISNNTLALILGGLIPLITVVALAIYILPEYMKKRRELKEIEEKVKKK